MKDKVKRLPAKQEKITKRPKLSTKIYDLQGRNTGTLKLAQNVFGQDPKPKLFAQAIRVYFSNVTKARGHTKTKGEVRGGGAKPWRQKGTGRARAGSRRSPLWVGGGITFGPRFKERKLELPKKMRQAVLKIALSQKFKSDSIKIVTNLEKIEPKTKNIALLLKKLDLKGKTLIVVLPKAQNIRLAASNIPNLEVETVENLNVYMVFNCNSLLFSKEAIGRFQ